MKKYIVLCMSIADDCEAEAILVCDSRQEATEYIMGLANACKNMVDRDKNICPDMEFECRKEESGDFDYSFWYIDAGIEECEQKYKIIEVEL